MEDLDVCAGETPRFAVVVEGKPIPDILWFKVFIHFSSQTLIYSNTVSEYQDKLNYTAGSVFNFNFICLQ